MHCTFIIIIIIIITGDKNVYYSEGSQPVSARPSGKGGQKHGEGWDSEEGSMLGSELLKVWSRGMKLNVWSRF
jgi:hypothetical protein